MRTRSIHFLLIALILAAAAHAGAIAQTAPATTTAPSEPTLQQRLDRLCVELDKQREALHIPGFAIAIVRGDDVILSRGFGVRDVEQNIPVTPETIFAVGSTTKAFTAALCAMLIDEGKMNWDDPVIKHLPEFGLHDPEADDGITIRDLLCHRSGLSRTDLLWASGQSSREEILEAIARTEPTAKFREKFQYQNVMYLAAGMASANAAGLDGDWDALLAQRILEPLGMTQSTTSIDEARATTHLSLGYVWDKEKSAFKHLPMRPLPAISPAGAINANVLDMARWLTLQINRGEVNGQRLIQPERFDEMWTSHISMTGSAEAAGAKVAYGLGWMLHDWEGRRVVEHGGNIDGFVAQVSFLPDEQLGYVLLANVSATPLQQMSINLVFDALLGEWKEQAEAPLDPTSMQDYLGKYRFDVMNTDVTVVMKDGKLAVDVPGQMVFTLKPPAPEDEPAKWFFEMTDQIAVSFQRDAAGKVISLTFFQSGMTFECPKEGVILPVEISLDDAQKYLGVYRDEDNKIDVPVVHHNGRLAVDVPQQMVYDLHLPNDEGKWVFRIKDDLAAKFEENEAGEVVAMWHYQGGGETRLPRVAEAPVTDVPAVDDVLALHARGCGSDRLAALGNARITASMNMPNQGIFDARITAICADLSHFVQHLDMGKFGWVKIGLNGAGGWSDSLFQSAEELPKDAAAATRFQHPFMPLYEWKGAFDPIEIARIETLDDREVIVVELTAGEGIRCTAFVDRETGLVPKMEYATVIPGITTIRTTELLSDWRDVSGVQVPFRWEIENDLYGKTVVEVEEIEMEIDLPADAFAMPKTR